MFSYEELKTHILEECSGFKYTCSLCNQAEIAEQQALEEASKKKLEAAKEIKRQEAAGGDADSEPE
eukprot:CAMPEP_0170503882 /NCGR_PEP_ID=MMETSP0208-20121228/46211_1 /TAXON_ID=197538 /ORGANISM="Strombidium inclinatum, Strain S3" /LENGTH=65 /DNA_ID=CAMNT_0010783787 /DNA_START=402 /DNA_END=599 /DNA_ORIENTATION=-